MTKKTKYIFLGLVFIIFIVLIFIFTKREEVVKTIEIFPDMTASEVADLLKKEEVIFSRNFFLFLVNKKGVASKIKAGEYKLSSKSTTGEIIKRLIKGKSLKIKLTIPEGYIAYQIACLIEKKKIGNRDRFMEIVKEKNLEGFLFPETSYFTKGTSEEKIIKVLTEQFNSVYTSELKQKQIRYNFTQKDVVTLASLIERETKREEEKRIISAVFHNRLKKGWYLESCATVLYALGKHKERLTYKDLKVDSPYNTYLHFGLPPGPICNPGLSSLKAALNPAQTEVMFFVANENGTHRFSRYYQEHLEIQNDK